MAETRKKSGSASKASAANPTPAPSSRAERRRKSTDIAEWYRVTAGVTHGTGIAQNDGEIVSGHDMGFRDTEGSPKPLSPEEQEERWGRVRYEPYNPSDEQLASLRRSVRRGHAPPLATVDEDEEDVFDTEEEDDEEATEAKDLKDMTDDELHEMAQAEGLHFPPDAPRKMVEGALAKKMADREKEQQEAAKQNG